MEPELRLPLALRLVQRIDFPHKLGACERLFGKRLQRSGICWVRCANGILWKLDLADSSHRWCVYGDYEGASQMRWIRHWLKDGGHVVDSGANIGQMTLSFLPLGDFTIHAFEPTRLAGDWLESCIRANALKNVRLVRSGLSSHSAKLPIQLNGPRSTLHLDWYRDHGLQTETVDLIPLDDYLKQLGISHVRLWKLDVEGHELEALSGASQALARRVIDAILIEVSRSTFEPVKALLRGTGNGLHSILRDGSTRPFDGTLSHTSNLVAMPVG